MLRFFKTTALIVKTTVLGGMLFMVPFIILIVVIGKAIIIIQNLLTPVYGMLGVSTISGVAFVKLLAIAILVIICFIAGLVAKSLGAKNFMQSLEANVLDKIPIYEQLKAKVVSMVSSDDVEEMKPVMVRFNDFWQLAFEIDRIEGGHTVIYLPGAPNPWSGWVCFVAEDRLIPLKLTASSAAMLMRRFGKGSKAVLPNPLCSVPDAVRQGEMR